MSIKKYTDQELNNYMALLANELLNMFRIENKTRADRRRIRRIELAMKRIRKEVLRRIIRGY